MEYFRRTSSYIFFGLVPTARKSICLLPLPVTFSFCQKDDNENIKETLTTTELPKQIPTKKLRTKKEKRAKQFIHSHSTKLDTPDQKVADPIKPLSNVPTTTIEKPQSQKKQSRQRVRSSTRHNNDEQIKHFDEEEHPVKKLVGVESKKNKNKKRFQIIGQEVKIKPKHSAALPITNSPPIATTTPSTPVTATNSPPVVEVPQTTPPPPPSSKPETVSTTTHAPLQSIAEIIKEEAATLLSTATSFSDEATEEISEAKENLQTTTSLPDPNDSTTFGEENNNNSTSTDNESGSSDSENDSDEENEEEEDANYDPAPVKKMKQFYENAKKSVHGVFDLKDEKDSS